MHLPRPGDSQRAVERMRLGHFRTCAVCQRGGFYPERGIWAHLTDRRGPGFFPDAGAGHFQHCTLGRSYDDTANTRPSVIGLVGGAAMTAWYLLRYGWRH